MNTGGFTTTLSTDACRTSIDGVMWEEYTREQTPSYLSAMDDFFYKQDTLDKIAFIWDEDSNVGEFDQTGEQEELKNTDTFIGNQKTKVSQKFTKQVPVSDEAFRTDQVGKRARIGVQVGDRARVTQDRTMVQDTYGDAFAGALNTTPDGLSLANAAHITLKGFIVDNIETGGLTPDNLWTLVTDLAGQKAQDGDAGGHQFEGILVPFTLYKPAKEVMNSALIPNSAENNLNIFDTDYGEVQIRASIFLGSQYNTNPNANTSYHCVSRNHSITRKVLYDLDTVMVDPQYTDNDTYLYRAKFHEAHLNGTWTGYVGSNGTT